MRPSKKVKRYTKQTKRKKLNRSPICKKHKHKSRRRWYTSCSSCDKYSDTLYEDVYPKKSDHAKDTKHWKVMPKDSCEVYRARRKRHQSETSTRVNENM